MSHLSSAPAITVEGVAYRYGTRQALGDVSFEVAAGEIFGLLGPNGGGKSTLFRLLSTLLPMQTGRVDLLGCDLRTQQAQVRMQIGVTFQSPSLDRKLTVRENLKHQGHLYGLFGADLQARIDRVLNRLGLDGRDSDRAETLSGGLQRRVEIAKGLLHDPQLLLLDEPSTGLDPGARLDLWKYLDNLRTESGVTVLVTTHLMDEAERCDRLGLLDRGQLVALGTPAELRCAIGGDCITVTCPQPEVLARDIEGRFGIAPRSFAGQLRIEVDRGHEFLRDLMEAYSSRISAVSLAKPTLEDVFVQHTGRGLGEEDDSHR